MSIVDLMIRNPSPLWLKVKHSTLALGPWFGTYGLQHGHRQFKDTTKTAESEGTRGGVTRLTTPGPAMPGKLDKEPFLNLTWIQKKHKKDAKAKAKVISPEKRNNTKDHASFAQPHKMHSIRKPFVA